MKNVAYKIKRINNLLIEAGIEPGVITDTRPGGILVTIKAYEEANC